MIDAVICDLDGVLIDSEPVWEDIRRSSPIMADDGGPTASGDSWA